MVKKIIGSAVILMSLSSPSFAALHLELTQGIDSAVPIAIVKFGGTNSGAQSFASDLNGIMKQDFTNTGRFRPIDTSTLQQPNSVSAVNLPYWQNQGVSDVVVGQVTPAGSGKYNVTFALLDVFKVKDQPAAAEQNLQNGEPMLPDSKPVKASKGKAPVVTAKPVVISPVLVQQTFTNIPASQMRALAHYIDDIIYLQLTGDRGIFSTKIAYVLVSKSYFGKKRYMLNISDYDGYGPKAILNSPQPIMSPAWMPDGKRIAYVSFEDSQAAIYLADLATGKRTLLSQFPGVNGAPAFSPDGRSAALVLTKTDQLKIYLMNLATKALTRITDGYSIDTEPSFSPDGKHLIFTSDRAGGPQIYQINLASKALQRLTFDGDYNARAAFTPDGKQIVLLHRTDSGSPYSIAVMDLDSGVLRVLVQGNDIQSPSVSPNGSMIIYSNRENSNGFLAEVSTDGKVQLQLPTTDGDVRDPAWSPFLSK